MPRVFDNMQEHLLPALQKTLEHSERADFCVGYFNLRAWKHLDEFIDRWTGENGSCCRLLVGMQTAPRNDLLAAYSLTPNGTEIDNQRAHRLRQRMADEFRPVWRRGNRGVLTLQELLDNLHDFKDYLRFEPAPRWAPP